MSALQNLIKQWLALILKINPDLDEGGQTCGGYIVASVFKRSPGNNSVACAREKVEVFFSRFVLGS